ncbi:hypothetical protein HNY73_021079 [Argiope bruennichi]|uniref:Uncharacterized protein n=1 Tax=Argiope bruennichi TaxID=94029 RepID=A0A8T0E8T5_ARGBR|nr:hypothetical protein HNY73_021079 [Argiope bruennichi]
MSEDFMPGLIWWVLQKFPTESLRFCTKGNGRMDLPDPRVSPTDLTAGTDRGGPEGCSGRLHYSGSVSIERSLSAERVDPACYDSPGCAADTHHLGSESEICEHRGKEMIYIPRV